MFLQNIFRQKFSKKQICKLGILNFYFQYLRIKIKKMLYYTCNANANKLDIKNNFK